MKLAAWTKDRTALKAASSGGIFFELAKYIISIGGVVCGVFMDGITPKFLMSSNLEEVKTMRGSKYIWADPKFMYQLIAKSIEKAMDHPILFVGLPCQVIGLKRYLRIKNLDDHNIFYVSLRCHGVIKTSIFRKYIEFLQQHRPVTDIIFRSKKDGWKGAGFGYGGYFYRPALIKNYIKSRNITEACKHCTKDRNDSDITLGDFWGCHPAYRNPHGTSVVELNTNKGKNLILAFTNKIYYNVVEEDVPIDANKIGLMKVEDIKNFGNLMLSSNFITYMKKINKHAEFVFLENESAQDTVEAATGVTDIEYRRIETPGLRKLKTLLFESFIGLVSPKHMEQVRVFADCQDVAVLGGDHFSGKGHYIHWVTNLIKLHALAKCGKSVHIVSNTVGPFPLFLRPFIRHVFNNLASIWCRDLDSSKRCYTLRVKKNIHCAPDLAFLPLHSEENPTNSQRQYCVIVPSTLWSRYAFTMKEYINGVKQMAEKLHTLTGLHVFIMPHSKYNMDKEIATEISNGDWSTCYFPQTPRAARGLLANSYLNISFRMHGAISSLKAGVPVVAIAYSEKYKGVISDGYALPQLVVPKMNRSSWNTCINKTIKKIKHARNCHRIIKHQIERINEQDIAEELYPLTYIAEGQE